MLALSQALAQPQCFILGPPGTGKTTALTNAVLGTILSHEGPLRTFHTAWAKQATTVLLEMFLLTDPTSLANCVLIANDTEREHLPSTCAGVRILSLSAKNMDAWDDLFQNTFACIFDIREIVGHQV